ncbi:MAG: hypothetical protein HGA36_01965 [Candidatus Moranbacteria bacterium]|nr:hypothetical protein [Candidatus Moranbacteria bacterium]
MFGFGSLEIFKKNVITEKPNGAAPGGSIKPDQGVSSSVPFKVPVHVLDEAYLVENELFDKTVIEKQAEPESKSLEIVTEPPHKLGDVNSGAENGTEKNKELIEKSFANVFSKDANKGVTIFSHKKDRETKIGNYLNNAFFPGNILFLLQEMFLEQHGDDADLSADNITERVKEFCLENMENVKSNSDEMKSAITAVCNKGKLQENVTAEKAEEIDEKLKSDIDSAWDGVCDAFEELGKKNNADRDSGLYLKESIDFFNEEAAKIQALSAEVNGRIKPDGSIAKYDANVLDFFNKHLEKISKLQTEYEQNKAKLRKPVLEKTGPNLENCKKLAANIFDITKQNIKKTYFASNLKTKEEYLQEFDEIRTDGLSQTDLEIFQALKLEAEKELSKILEKRIKDLDEGQKELSAAEIEALDQQKKNELEKEIKDKFEKAIEKISHINQSEFDFEYDSFAVIKKLDYDYTEKIREYLEASHEFLFDHIDAHSSEEQDAWNKLNVAMNTILSDVNTKEIIVVDDKVTYVVDRSITKVENLQRTLHVNNKSVDNLTEQEKIKKTEEKKLKAGQAKNEKENIEKLYQDANKEALGILSIELFQRWQDGYVEIASQNNLGKKEVKQQMKVDIEKAFSLHGKKEGKELDKVVQYVIDQLK